MFKVFILYGYMSYENSDYCIYGKSEQIITIRRKWQGTRSNEYPAVYLFPFSLNIYMLFLHCVICKLRGGYIHITAKLPECDAVCHFVDQSHRFCTGCIVLRVVALLK